jgi:hypothetical protein
MSHQGPGGYGGGPPAGGPPGGYGGYGGYGGGGPPGGPGQPGGHGPPGAPGYPPAQYPQQPAPPPGYGAPPPKKKSNTALFVGLGCGLFLLLAAGAATAIYLWTKDTIDDAVTAASAFGAAVGSAPIVVPGVPAAPGAGAPAGGSGTCERARICCEKILARSGNQNSALNCNALRTLPDTSCTQMLTAYTSMAAALGDSCQ